MTEQSIKFSLVENFFAPIPQNDEEYAKSMLLSGKYKECLDFLGSLPTGLVEQSPILLVYQAAAMLFSEFPQNAIEAVLIKAEQLKDGKHLIGEISAIRAIIYSYTTDPEESIKCSLSALDKIEADNTYFRNMVERNLGVAYTIKNDLRNANRWFENLLMSSYQLQDWGGVLASYNYLTYIRKVQGRLREAEVIYRKALDFIQKYDLEHMPHGIKIIAGYGQLLLYTHQIDEAKSYFKKAIHLSNHWDTLYAYTAYQYLCEAHLRENDIQGALAILSELRQHVKYKEDLYEKIHLQHTLAIEARIHLEAGQIEDAYCWLISSGFEDLSPHELHQHFGYKLGYILPIATRIYIRKDMSDRAIQVLLAIIPKFIHQGANSYLIRALCALALAYHQEGLTTKAHNAIIKAMKLAEPENNLGDFMFLGRSLLPVLSEYPKMGSSQAFSEKLIALLAQGCPQKHHNSDRKADPRWLSPREIDVLQLISEGMTNRQIALTLFLSSNTVKSHSINIYRKLKVDNRNQAVSKARSLGLLPTPKDPLINLRY